MAAILVASGGDIEPHPGPSFSKPLIPRGPLDLQSGFTAATTARMAQCLAAFQEWVLAEFKVPFSRLCLSPEPLSLALRAYGLFLFASGFPRYRFVYAITAVQDACPSFRNQLSAAWQIDRKWQHQEPGECRPVISVPIVQAMTAIALAWGWRRSVYAASS